MVRPAALPFAIAGAIAAFLAAGCSDSSSTTSSSGEYPTLLSVDPALFRGQVTCGAPGLERYVATVTDISVVPNALFSSLPTPCQTKVSFGSPVVGLYHYYTATIDGYDRTDIQAQVAGKREMVDSANTPVSPVWTTTCGHWPPIDAPDAAVDEDAAVEDAGADTSTSITPYMQLRSPTFAIGNVEVIFHGCLPLVAAEAPDASAPDDSSAFPEKSASPEQPGVGSLDPIASRDHDVDGGEPSR
jgi:hypothetical protein